MNPTNSTNPQLGAIHNSLPTQVQNLSPANTQAPEANKAQLGQAQDLANSSSGKSIHNRQPEVKQEEASGLTKYELLADLPPGLIAHIVKDLSQKDLSNFFYSIHPDLLAVVESKQKEHWSIRLLDAFLNQIPVPIDFDQPMFEIIGMAKCLGIQTVFSRVPSMRIDFKRNSLSYQKVMEVFNEMSIGVKQLELEGLYIKKICSYNQTFPSFDTSKLRFSTKCFPSLESLKIAYSKALQRVEVEDENVALKALTVVRCPSLTTIKIQSCNLLNRLECVDVKRLSTIKMAKQNNLKELTLKEFNPNQLDLDKLGRFLQESCEKLSLELDLNLQRVKRWTLTYLGQFVCTLKKLRALELMVVKDECDENLVINLEGCLSLNCLEKINFYGVDLDLQDASTGMLKELCIKYGKIESGDCLKGFTALEALIGYFPPSNKEFADTLADLTKLKKLAVNCASIDDCSPLVHLLDLEELDLSNASQLTQASLDTLTTLKNLKKLSIKAPFTRDSTINNLDFLKTLENLEELSLNCSVLLSSTSFSFLEHLTKLKKIELTNVVIDNLNFLSALRSLEYLKLDACKILSLDSFNQISLLKNLKRLNLNGTLGVANRSREINTEFLKDLVELEALDLGYNLTLDKKKYAVIGCLKNLKHLDLFWSSIEDIGFLSELIKLETLNLGSCIKLKCSELNPIKNLRKLRFLNLEGISVKDLSLFEDLKDLEYINLRLTIAFHQSSKELVVFPSRCQVYGLEASSE